jgi:hypothetical protein
MKSRIFLLLVLAGTIAALGQSAPLSEPAPQVPKVMPVPPLPQLRTAPPEPSDPAPRNFADPVTHLSFHIPAGWTLSRTDGEISTFRDDARTATPETRLRAVAAMSFNPFPWSTLSGAYFYFSTAPHSTKAACAAQAAEPTAGAASMSKRSEVIDNETFTRGHEEHGKICVESRDDVLTELRRNSCLRFDLIIHTFCAASSGAREMTQTELDQMRGRLQRILESVQFEKEDVTPARGQSLP